MFERGWRLQFPGCDLSFGGIDPADQFRRNRGRVVLTEAPTFSDTEVETEDSGLARRDGIRFGQDYRRGMTVTFGLQAKGAGATNAAAAASARALIGDLQKAWRGDGVRLIPGAMAKLTTQQGGQLFTLYGRPRKFTPAWGQVSTGEVSVVCTFDTMDDRFYGAEQASTVSISRPASEGGFAWPIAWPTPLASSQVVAGTIVNDGDLEAAVWARIYGPITNPAVSMTGGWKLRLITAIPAGQWVDVDARPWVMSVVSSKGVSLAGVLDRTQARLADAKVPAGTSEIGLSGTDLTGTAYMVVRWSASHASMT